MLSICKAWFPQNHGPSIRVVIPLAAVLLPWRNSSMACIKGHAAKPFKASVHVTCHGLLDQSKILKKVILFSQKLRVSDFSEVRNDGIWAHKCPWTLSGTRQQFLFFVLATFLSLQVKRKQLTCQYLQTVFAQSCFWGSARFFPAAGNQWAWCGYHNQRSLVQTHGKKHASIVEEF